MARDNALKEQAARDAAAARMAEKAAVEKAVKEQADKDAAAERMAKKEAAARIAEKAAAELMARETAVKEQAAKEAAAVHVAKRAVAELMAREAAVKEQAAKDAAAAYMAQQAAAELTARETALKDQVAAEAAAANELALKNMASPAEVFTAENSRAMLVRIVQEATMAVQQAGGDPSTQQAVIVAAAMAAAAQLDLARTEPPSTRKDAADLPTTAAASVTPQPSTGVAMSNLPVALSGNARKETSPAAAEQSVEETEATGSKRKHFGQDTTLPEDGDEDEEPHKRRKGTFVYKCIDFKSEYESYSRKCTAKGRDETEMAKLWAAKGSKRKEGFQLFMKAGIAY